MPEELIRQSVVLDHQPVELYKILKFEGLAASGAEAKLMIDEGLVQVNGAVETRRRKKIVNGDVVSMQGIELSIECDASGELN